MCYLIVNMVGKPKTKERAMKAVMSMAHQVREAAAKTWGGKPGDYLMSIALKMAWEAHRTIKENTMPILTIREFIQEATKDAKTQVDLDKIWHAGFPRKIQEAFPEASASEIMYEWDSVKIRIRKMV